VFDPLALATEHTDWLARGSVGLDGTLDFALVAVVPPEFVPQMPRNLLTTAGSLMNPDGRLTLDLRLGGTVRKPELGWDSNRTASRFLANTGGHDDLLARRLGVTPGDSLAHSATLEEAADRVVEAQKQKLVLRAVVVVGPLGGDPLWTSWVWVFIQEGEKIRVNGLVMPHARITGKSTCLITAEQFKKWAEGLLDMRVLELQTPTAVGGILGTLSSDLYVARVGKPRQLMAVDIFHP
jgi:hypothetical protein